MNIKKLTIALKDNNAQMKRLVNALGIPEKELLSAENINEVISKTNEVIDELNSVSTYLSDLKYITAFNYKESKDTYADLLLLTELEPNDAFGVLADGLVYIWNGTSFPEEGDGLDLGLRPDENSKVEEGNTQAVSGGEVYNYVKEVDDDLVQLAGDGYYTIMNRYIDRSSGLVTGGTQTTSKATDYIAFDKSRGISLKSVFSNSSQSPCSFYDENKIFLSSYDTGINGTQDINIPPEEIPENAIFFRSTAMMSEVPILELSLADILYSSKTEEEILRKNISDGIFTHVGYYIDKLTGDEVANPGAKCTDYIPCLENQVIPLIGTIRSSLIADCVFFDADKKFLSSFSGNQESCIAPTGAYFFRLTASINNEASTTPNLSAVINEIHRQSGKYYNPFTEIDMYTDGSDGNVSAAANLKTTKLIPLINGFTYTLVGVRDNRGATPACVFYDANKDYISRVSIPEENYNIGTIVLSAENIPENATYFRANAVKTTKAYIEAPYMAILMDIANRDIEIDTSDFVTKEIGKGLSTEDFTLAEKAKVDKLLTTGEGSKALMDDGTYKNVSGGTIIESFIPEKLPVKSISSSTFSTDKPIVCLTFDDGYLTDYTTLKPFLESRGIVGTCYIHEEGMSGRITNEQIIEMAANGWEFGSHTKNHVHFGEQAARPVALGSSYIEVITSAGRNYFSMDNVSELKFYIRDGFSVYEFSAIASEVTSNDTIRLTLSTPATFQTSVNRPLWLHEESIRLLAIPPKERIESLGIQCNGFAYTWGGYTDTSRSVIRQLFGYGRGAQGGANGAIVEAGLFESDYYPVDQHVIMSTELIDMSSAQMDEAIVELKARKGLLIILGHTSSGTTLYNALDLFISKVQAAGGIEFKTVSEALDVHGNSAQLGDFGIGKGAIPNKGITLRPRKSIHSETQVNQLPSGVTIIRVNGKQDGEILPANVGTLVIIKTNSPNGYTAQLFFEFQSNRMWRRQSISLSDYTEWVRIDGFDAYTTANRPIDRLSVGQRLFDTTLNKPIWYDGSKWVDATGVEV